LAQNVNNNSNSEANNKVNDGTYVAFLSLTLIGAALAWTLVDAKHVVRSDGTRIILMKNPTWKSELLGLWETVFTDPYILFLFPMFFASNWFYTYQFNAVNLARFNIRTRALNNTVYWIAQIFGASFFGFALDISRWRRTTRAMVAWGVLMLLTLGIWAGGYVFQKGFTRADVNNGTPANKDDDPSGMDWQTPGYLGPMFLYIFYGFYDASWQTCVYW
jgi:hypothetical protein